MFELSILFLKYQLYLTLYNNPHLSIQSQLYLQSAFI